MNFETKHFSICLSIMRKQLNISKVPISIFIHNLITRSSFLIVYFWLGNFVLCAVTFSYFWGC